MMTEEKRIEVELMAGLFFTRPEVMIITGIPEESSAVEMAEFDLAFEKGRLMAEAEIRKSIFEHAKNGSSPAQQMATKIMEDTKLGERF